MYHLPNTAAAYLALLACLLRPPLTNGAARILRRSHLPHFLCIPAPAIRRSFFDSGSPRRGSSRVPVVRSAVRDHPRDARVCAEAVRRRQTAAVTALPSHREAPRRHHLHQPAADGGGGGRGVGTAYKGMDIPGWLPLLLLLSPPGTSANTRFGMMRNMYNTYSNFLFSAARGAR